MAFTPGQPVSAGEFATASLANSPPASAAIPVAAPPGPPTYAFDKARSVLSHYGLATPSMVSWVQAQIVDGASDETIALGLREQPEFKARFSAITDIQAWNQAHPLAPARHVPTPEEVLQYETGATALFRAAGLPQGFYDEQRDIQGFMVNDLSLQELQSRVMDGYRKVMDAPPLIKEAFGNFFGPNGDAALAAFFLDPAKAAATLERLVTEAQIAGTGVRFGVHVTQNVAERLAALGIDVNGATSGFGKIGDMSALFSETVSEAKDLTAEQHGIGSVFEGNQAFESVINRRFEQRQADFGGAVVGGAVDPGSGKRRGLTGLGSADDAVT